MAPRYLLRYAVDAGRADELAADADFLLHADLTTLMPALDRAGSELCRRTAAVFRMSWDAHQDADADQRRQLLAIDAARQRYSALRASLGALAPVGDWYPHWAISAEINADVQMVFDHGEDVGAVAGTEIDGRPTVVTGSRYDATVRVWDAGTGQLRGEIHTGLKCVDAMACATVQGRPVVSETRRGTQ
jgi:hypothetical protein